MKRTLWILFVVVVLLGSLGIGFCLGYLTETLSYDQIAGRTGTAHPKAAHSIGIFYEGDYPGLSDTPVTAQQAAPGRAALNALRGQKYTRAFPFRNPQEGGICISECAGCCPSDIAYWDGKYLFLPAKNRGWQGYIPSDPDKLREKLESIVNK